MLDIDRESWDDVMIPCLASVEVDNPDNDL